MTSVAEWDRWFALTMDPITVAAWRLAKSVQSDPVKLDAWATVIELNRIDAAQQRKQCEQAQQGQALG